MSLEALDKLVYSATRGNPKSFLRWTSKSTAKLADDLVRQGFEITDDTIGRILKSLGYSLQASVKEKEGTAHPDRHAQLGFPPLAGHLAMRLAIAGDSS
jgi:hypothetical protein